MTVKRSILTHVPFVPNKHKKGGYMRGTKETSQEVDTVKRII